MHLCTNLNFQIINTIKAILFDVDGVLIDSFKANHKFFSDLMQKFGYGFMKLEEYIHHFHKPTKEIIKHSTNLTDEEEIMKIWRASKDREVPYPDHLLGAPQDMEEIIKRLSEKYLLGIVTSRSVTAFSVPQVNALKKYFHSEVIYTDTEKHKPEPDPLLLACKRMNLLPAECVYVGDSETDVTAAKAAGMKAIRYSTRVSPEADANITDFGKLEETISNL